MQFMQVPRCLDFGDVFSGSPPSLSNAFREEGTHQKVASFDVASMPHQDILTLDGFLDCLLLLMQIRPGYVGP